MKKQYDFSQGVRGRFYRARARFRLPVYLDPTVQEYLAEVSSRTGKDICTLVNGVLKKEIEVHKVLS